MTEKQIKRATFRLIAQSPGHVTYGIWINGRKSGDLTVRKDEKMPFVRLLINTGFTIN